MTENAVGAIPRESFRPHVPLISPARDTSAVAWRNIIGLLRVPRFFIFTLVQPVIFVLLFRYVFGGAIQTPTGVPYVDYLMPGIFIQTVTFGSITTGISMATDYQSGLLERFRSLPMARSAVLGGRTMADLARNVIVVILIASVGFAVGFRVHTNALAFLAGLLMVLTFAYVLSWVFSFVGMATRDPETSQAASFPVVAPLVFASSAFVPVSTMPSWLQGFATYQPVSCNVNAVRALCLGGPTTTYVLQALAWDVAILAVFAPLAIWVYRRSV